MNEHLLAPGDVAALRRAELTYPEIGGTRTEMPAGYRHLRRVATIGTGEDRFSWAADIVLRWGMQRRAGLRVRSSSDTVTTGGVAVLTLGFGGLGLQAPVRVVYVVDEPDRSGFAYGTLPGHPESGEEAFMVGLQPDDTVIVTVTGFSRPSSRLSKLAGPLKPVAQEWVTGRYLRALRG